MRDGKIVVCERAGHGGKDRANRGPNGYIEADGNLMFDKYFVEAFEGDDRFIAHSIRTEDVFIPIRKSPHMAKVLGCDIYIIVHSDAYTKYSSGVTVYDSVDQDNELLAAKVGQAIADAMGIPFRGARERGAKKNPNEDYYGEIDEAQDIGIPFVILIERGLHSNPREEKLLMDSVVVNRSAVAAKESISKFFNPEEIIERHWVQDDVDYLKDIGVELSEERYDEIITRGEAVALVVKYDKSKSKSKLE